MTQKQVGIGFVILLIIVGLFAFFAGTGAVDMQIPGKTPSPTPADISTLQFNNEEDNSVEKSIGQLEESANSNQQSTMDTTNQQPSKNNKYSTAPQMTINAAKKYTAVISTNKGDMTAELYPQDAPNTVNNFVFLAREKFYDGLIFHRVISGFMIQGGDPTGTGSGGPGYRFADEKVTRKYDRGILAMANAGPNTNGSQFFIMHKDYPLPPNYTIFGKVTSGLETIDAIANTPTGANDRPTQNVVINSITIQEQ